MERFKRNRQSLIFVAFIVVSAILGWSIPRFYEWSGTRQSRPTPLIFLFTIGLTVVGIGFCFLLPWMPNISERREPDERLPIQFQFNIPRILAMTAVVAVWIAIFAWSKLAASILIFIGIFVYCAWFMVRTQRDRWAVAALLSCMFLPYIWLAGYREVGQLMPTILAGMFAFPALIPNLLICRLLGQHIEQLLWIGALLTSAQMGLGFWMIRFEPKRTIAFLGYSLLAALFGSFFFYQGVRA